MGIDFGIDAERQRHHRIGMTRFDVGEYRKPRRFRPASDDFPEALRVFRRLAVRPSDEQRDSGVEHTELFEIGQVAIDVGG